MSAMALHLAEPTEKKHPRCLNCGVPMWMTKMDVPMSSDPNLTRQYYECKVCEAVAVIAG